MPDAVEYARANRAEFERELGELLGIPSVSTLPAHRGDVLRAAEWLAARLRERACAAEVLPTAGHPVVYGENLRAGPRAPVMLFYGHYDVQPAEPLSEWRSPPFQATARGENLYARGASDMKGQVICFLSALASWTRTRGQALPVNLKLLLEGEEELGSPSLPGFLRREKARLRCDFCLNGDATLFSAEQPALTCGLRGIAYFELTVRGPAQDLHSGTFGGAVHNPAIVLAELIAGMHDARGRIVLPGFYERVRPLSAEERAELARIPADEAWWRAQSGAAETFGEEGYTSLERAGVRPSLDVNGLWSGFTGEGAKTVLPARAAAKLSFRLVPDQRTAEVQASLETYLRERAPATVQWDLRLLSAAPPALVSRDSPAVRAARAALEAVWAKPPLFIRWGGSVPAVSFIQQELGVDSLLLGFGLPDDHHHAPNEKQHLPTFHRGVETYLRLLELLAACA